MKLDVSAESVAEVCKYLGSSWSGFNPLGYVKTTCDECEESERADEWDCEYRVDFDKKMCYECWEKK